MQRSRNKFIEWKLYKMVGFLWNSLFKILPPLNVTEAFAPEKGE